MGWWVHLRQRCVGRQVGWAVGVKHGSCHLRAFTFRGKSRDNPVATYLPAVLLRAQDTAPSMESEAGDVVGASAHVSDRSQAYCKLRTELFAVGISCVCATAAFRDDRSITPFSIRLPPPFQREVAREIFTVVLDAIPHNRSPRWLSW